METTISQPADAKEKILRASAAQVKTVLGDLHSQLNSTLNQLDADRDRILEAVTLRYKQHHDEVLAMAQKKEAALKEQEAKLSAHANVLTKDVTDVVGQISALDPEDNALELVQTCLKIINEVRNKSLASCLDICMWRGLPMDNEQRAPDGLSFFVSIRSFAFPEHSIAGTILIISFDCFFSFLRRGPRSRIRLASLSPMWLWSLLRRPTCTWCFLPLTASWNRFRAVGG